MAPSHAQPTVKRGYEKGCGCSPPKKKDGDKWTRKKGKNAKGIHRDGEPRGFFEVDVKAMI
jgi:hypothetical protein